MTVEDKRLVNWEAWEGESPDEPKTKRLQLNQISFFGSAGASPSQIPQLLKFLARQEPHLTFIWLSAVQVRLCCVLAARSIRRRSFAPFSPSLAFLPSCGISTPQLSHLQFCQGSR